MSSDTAAELRWLQKNGLSCRPPQTEDMAVRPCSFQGESHSIHETAAHVAERATYRHTTEAREDERARRIDHTANACQSDRHAQRLSVNDHDASGMSG